MSTPHIWAHVTLEPGEERTVEFTAPPGPYRLRTLEIGPETDIEHDGACFPAVVAHRRRGDRGRAAASPDG